MMALILGMRQLCQHNFKRNRYVLESGIMLAADCTNQSKQLRYSNRAVSNSNITVTQPLSL